MVFSWILEKPAVFIAILIALAILMILMAKSNQEAQALWVYSRGALTALFGQPA